MHRSLAPFNNPATNRLLNHSIFWTVIVLVTAYHGSLFGGTFRINLVNMISLLPVQIFTAYFLVYFQIPKLFFKGLRYRFILSILSVGWLSAILARLSIIYIAEPFLELEPNDETLWQIVYDPVYLIKVYLTSVYLPAIVLFLIKMTKERFVQKTNYEKLEKEKRTAELKFLKAQINPHFLFNTLNNIYSLANNNSEQTPNMILKLSEMLNYTLYECSASRVSIIKEWELIENFSDLEALRHIGKLDLALYKNIDNPEIQIAPLILISLVENAFKYGAGKNKSGTFIRINMKVEEGDLTFEIQNSIDKSTSSDKLHDKKGIGLKNVRKQLEMLYPEQHQLNVEKTQDYYKTILTIKL